MPRVSRSMNRTARTTEVCSMESIKNEVKMLFKKRQKKQKDLLNFIEEYYAKKLLAIPENILDKTIMELTPEDMEIIKNAGEAVPSDLLVEPQPRASRTTGTAKGTTHKKMAVAQMKVSKWQTPANQQVPPHHMGTVTPKFNPYAPMSVVRVPKEGEMAMSLTGSPLRVTAVFQESKPNVLVPLTNGKVLSVLPERGMRMSEIPEIDEELKNQLQVLNENLNMLLTKPSRRKV